MKKLLHTICLSLLFLAAGISANAQAYLKVDGNTYPLSEETATEFGVLPEGCEFIYTITQGDTKTVMFQILDVTANEMLKSVVDKRDENGLSGEISFALPKKYELAKGHTYEAQFIEYNSTKSLTIKQPTANHNYLFAGQADVAVYSNVKCVGITPSTSTSFDDFNVPITITFSEPIASLSVRAVLGQMSGINISSSDITTTDNITWQVKINEFYISAGNLSLNFYAIDYEGNRVTDPNNGVGTPETCYINYSWSSIYGLPVPKLLQENKEYSTPVTSITFLYDGIGLNQDVSTSTWKDIKISHNGKDLGINITENMFKIGGNESVGGTQLTMTLPEPLEYNGTYTVTLPARAFVLGHDNSNDFNGPQNYTFIIKDCKDLVPTIKLTINKFLWSRIGSDSGETIGTAYVENIDKFDHFEYEIICQEDPSQYITFASSYSNPGNITTYQTEDLYKGYHYTLNVKAFDVPYYGVAPIVTTKYEFVGTGKAPILYSDITIVSTSLKPNAQGYGWDCAGNSFDVTFSAPVVTVRAWWAQGMLGSVNATAVKKDADGKVWTIILPDGIDAEDESSIASANINITAWDAEGKQIKGENGDHSYAYNIVVTGTTGIESVGIDCNANAPAYNVAGQRVSASDKGIIIINGRKYINK